MFQRKIRPTPLTLALAVSLAVSTAAQTSSFTEKLEISAAQVGDYAGTSVAASGDRIVVGAHQDDGTPPYEDGPGRAVVYVRQGNAWVVEAELTGALAGDTFGWAVDIDGNRLIVGAPQAGPPAGTGRAYVYLRVGSTWVLESELVAPGLLIGDGFGRAVAIGPERAVVGAPDGDGGGYLFERGVGGWQFRTRLLPDSGPDFSAEIGSAVDVDGTRVAVAASGFDWQGYDSGTVYLFEPSPTAGPTTWDQTAWLLASDGATVTYVGTSVSLEGDTLVAGSQNEAAYVFRNGPGGWQEALKLVASDAGGYQDFGRSVDLDGARIAVGAPARDGPGTVTGAGAAYLFAGAFDTWVETEVVTAADAASWDELGRSVALGGDRLVAGSPRDDGATGAAYTLELAPAAIWVDLGAALAGASGAPELAGAGTRLAGEPVGLLLEQAAPNALAYLAFGTGALGIPLLGGTLVPDPSTGAALPLFTDGNGALLLEFAWPAGIPGTADFYAQFWVLDFSAPQLFAASNAVVGSLP